VLGLVAYGIGIDVRHDLQRAVGIWLLNGSDVTGLRLDGRNGSTEHSVGTRLLSVAEVTGLRLDGRNGSTEHSVGIRLLRVVEVTGVGFRFGTAVPACHV